ncbi:hypothetical protein Plo01_54700 [Planobispora longispora]|uniref:Uncharacterized protein n=1 Tax=Planobispora longispora TaxID=28887 RepID=A0A8J3RRT6_9ACTN|nr:hypothetical protein Plo01_54700 [Planobispora longispora]
MGDEHHAEAQTGEQERCIPYCGGHHGPSSAARRVRLSVPGSCGEAAGTHVRPIGGGTLPAPPLPGDVPPDFSTM